MTPTQRVQAGKSALPDRFKQTQGQPGGMRSIPSQGKRDAFVNLQRQKFFGDRDVPEERVLRRTRQEGGVRQFKDALIRNDRVLKGTRPDGSTYTVMNPNTGEPVYLTDVPGGRSVGDVSRDFAYRFGPTPREVAGDIGYGLSQFGSALGQKVMAGEFGLMGIAKGLYEQFTNSAAKAKDALVKGVNKLSDIDLEVLKKKDTGEFKFLSKKPEIQEIDALEQEEKGAIGLANEAGKTLDLAPLNATQRSTYDMLTSKVNPLTHEQALNQVQSQFIDNRSLQEKLQDISKNNIRTQNGQSSAITDQQMNDAINKSNQIFGDDSFRRLPGSGYQAGAGLPTLLDSQTNNIQIQGGQTTPITNQEFMEKEQQANEIFNDPFFNQTSNQMSGAPGFEIVTDYKSPEARMQELIEKNKVNNTNMFDLGINKAKNQLSELERVFGVDMQ